MVSNKDVAAIRNVRKYTSYFGVAFFASDLSKSLDIIEQKISSSIFSNAYNFSWLCRPHFMYVRGAIAIGKIEEVLLDSHLSSHKCEHHHDKLVSLVLSY